jgi:nucleoside-diphosphate-sugar epimerase
MYIPLLVKNIELIFMCNKIIMLGGTGFVGKNLISYFEGKYQINALNRNQEIVIHENIVIQVAGKAHDLKNKSNPDKYYQVNTELTKKVFDAFLTSKANVFITLSSVMAVADSVEEILTEEALPNPITHYGKSKMLAEEYILSKKIPLGKRVYILRPCMIHGPGNKGNLNLLYKIVKKGLPWPLGAYENKRSFCSIDNLSFIIEELILNDQISSGIYNISDDDPVSTNELIGLIASSQFKKPHIFNIPKFFIHAITKIGDVFRLPLNTERLQKLTETYIVSNKKIKQAINKPLPLSSKEGLFKTFNSFSNT